MSLASVVLDPLTAGLDATKFKVTGHPGVVARPSKRTVAAWVDEFAPLPQAPSQYQVTLTVLILSAHQDPAKADEDLDEALTTVLDVLWRVPAVLFQSANRATYADGTVQGWSLTFNAVITATEESA